MGGQESQPQAEPEPSPKIQVGDPAYAEPCRNRNCIEQYEPQCHNNCLAAPGKVARELEAYLAGINQLALKKRGKIVLLGLGPINVTPKEGVDITLNDPPEGLNVSQVFDPRGPEGDPLPTWGGLMNKNGTYDPERKTLSFRFKPPRRAPNRAGSTDMLAHYKKVLVEKVFEDMNAGRPFEKIIASLKTTRNYYKRRDPDYYRMIDLTIAELEAYWEESDDEVSSDDNDDDQPPPPQPPRPPPQDPKLANRVTPPPLEGKSKPIKVKLQAVLNNTMSGTPTKTPKRPKTIPNDKKLQAVLNNTMSGTPTKTPKRPKTIPNDKKLQAVLNNTMSGTPPKVISQAEYDRNFAGWKAARKAKKRQQDKAMIDALREQQYAEEKKTITPPKGPPIQKLYKSFQALGYTQFTTIGKWSTAMSFIFPIPNKNGAIRNLPDFYDVNSGKDWSLVYNAFKRWNDTNDPQYTGMVGDQSITMLTPAELGQAARLPLGLAA